MIIYNEVLLQLIQIINFTLPSSQHSVGIAGSCDIRRDVKENRLIFVTIYILYIYCLILFILSWLSPQCTPVGSPKTAYEQ